MSGERGFNPGQSLFGGKDKLESSALSQNALRRFCRGDEIAMQLRGIPAGGRSRLFGNAVFFVLGAEDAVDGVGGAAAGFVVVADLHFSEQADGEQVESAKQ
jgi:hypothetical protein